GGGPGRAGAGGGAPVGPPAHGARPRGGPRRGRPPARARGGGARAGSPRRPRAAAPRRAASMSPLRPIPEGLPTITPHLVVSDAARAIELYAAALGAHEISRIVGPDGRRVVFAELILGDSRFFVVDEFPEQRAFSPTTLGGTPVALHVYFADVDAAYARAVA